MVLRHVVGTQRDSWPDLDALLSELGLNASADDLRSICEAVITKLPKEAERVRQGNEKVVMRLVGEVMKMSKGSADARKAKELLLELLNGV